VKISRRNFVGAMTGVTATLWSLQPIGPDPFGSSPECERDCVLLDLDTRCALRESFEGFRDALAGIHSCALEADLASGRRCRTAIAPGLGAMDLSLASSLAVLLDAGTNVVLESAAGFLSAPEFASQQNVLLRYFNIALDPPVDLWLAEPTRGAGFPSRSGRHPKKTPSGNEVVPYVSYLWPRETKVRDFSRVVPVSARPGDVIGSLGTFPVAVKKRVGNATLIFLGSPLGPALRAGDLEAHSWLQSVIAL
jgi:hypothetical protein